MSKENSYSLGDLALYSIRSPFLLSSLAVHLLIFQLLAKLVLSVNPAGSNLSIPIQLLELREGGSQDKSIGPKRGPGGPRSLPKRGRLEIPRERSGKLNSGSLETAVASKESSPAPEPVPALPAPKVLTGGTRPRPLTLTETSPDSLVQLPTRDSATNLLSAVSPDGPKGSLTPVKGRGEGEGIRALKEELQVPGALKGGGSGSVPYGVPGGISDGTGTTGGGTGTGSGGGGYAAIRGRSSADYLQYLKLIEKRVYSVWRYPDGVTGVQKVSVRFALDKVGRVTQADVLDSTDARINASALEAMKRASPFPPIPERLKDLAGEPLIIRFTVAIRLKG